MTNQLTQHKQDSKKIVFLIFGIMILAIITLNIIHIWVLLFQNIQTTDFKHILNQLFYAFFYHPLFLFRISNILLGISLLILGIKGHDAKKMNYYFLMFSTIFTTFCLMLYLGYYSWKDFHGWNYRPILMLENSFLSIVCPIFGLISLSLIFKKVTLTWMKIFLPTIFSLGYLVIISLMHLTFISMNGYGLDIGIMGIGWFRSPEAITFIEIALRFAINISLIVIVSLIIFGITMLFKLIFQIKIEKPNLLKK